MKAVCYDVFKGRKWHDAKAKPTPKKGQVLVRVKAAAINPVDYKLQAAALFLHGKGMGLDLSGEVVELGADVKDLAVGDRVFGNTRGSLAEFAVCAADEVAKVPDSLSTVEAAALPTAFLSAYQALHDHGFKAGQKLLVIGASGGTGTAGVMLGKAMGGDGGEVVGVCSQKNADMVLGLGADRVIDYKTQNVDEALQAHSVDFVFDTATGSGAGEDYVAASHKVLKPDAGMYVALNGSVGLWLRHALGLEKAREKLILTKHRRQDLEEIARLLGQRKSKPIIDTVMPFTHENVEKGFEALKTRRTKGKIVLTMGDDDPVATANASANTVAKS